MTRLLIRGAQQTTCTAPETETQCCQMVVMKFPQFFTKFPPKNKKQPEKTSELALKGFYLTFFSHFQIVRTEKHSLLKNSG